MEKQFVLTQEILDNWIANLESGKYTQGFRTLTSQTLSGQTFCCVGVLGDCTKGLSNTYDEDENENPYRFLERSIGNDKTWEIVKKNDSGEKSSFEKRSKRDYSNVLPMIKALKNQLK